MKDTATSCMLVSALIVTIMFAVAFPVAGGSDQDTGLPMFSRKKLFMLFIISIALSLFSSSTSILMFLGILIARYVEEHFLKSLPQKMIIGLSTLFLSIATMMAAFCLSLFIMLPRHSRFFIPIICLASLPVRYFVFLQFSIFVEMFKSTNGPSIFDRKMKRWLYVYTFILSCMWCSFLSNLLSKDNEFHLLPILDDHEVIVFQEYWYDYIFVELEFMWASKTIY